MENQLIIDTLNQLIEEERFDYAQQIVFQNSHLHNNVEFNDAYATLLYLLDKYEMALNVLKYNLELIGVKNNNTHWLTVTYFQMANCYAALGFNSKAEVLYDLCLTENEKFEYGLTFNHSNKARSIIS